MGHLDDIKARLLQLQGEAGELQRDIAAAALDRAKGEAGTEDRIRRLTTELRTNEDLQAAEKLALDHAAQFAAEAATRERHQRVNNAAIDLQELVYKRRELGGRVDSAALALAAALRAFRENCNATRQLALTASQEAFRSLSPDRRGERTSMISGCLGVDDYSVVDACATLVATVFELTSHEGQHLYRQVLTGMDSGSGYHPDKTRTFSQAASDVGGRLPHLLVPWGHAMAAEAAGLGPDPAKPEGLLA